MYQNAKTHAKHYLWRKRKSFNKSIWKYEKKWKKNVHFDCFQLLRVSKRWNAWKVIYLEKQDNITKNVDFECFLHCKVTVRQSTLYGEKRQYLKERIFSMFMNVLNTKRLRECKPPYMEKQNDLTKNVYFGCLWANYIPKR